MDKEVAKLCSGSEYGQISGRFERQYFILDQPWYDIPHFPGPKGENTHDAQGRNIGWLKLKERARGRRW